MNTQPTFWMVWNPAGRCPYHQHTKEDSAVKEANRLAELHPGESFVVVMAISSFTRKRAEETVYVDPAKAAAIEQLKKGDEALRQGVTSRADLPAKWRDDPEEQWQNEWQALPPTQRRGTTAIESQRIHGHLLKRGFTNTKACALLGKYPRENLINAINATLHLDSDYEQRAGYFKAFMQALSEPADIPF